MGDYTPVKGDRVRVVLEGEIGWVGARAFEFATSANYIVPDETVVVSVEKVEPPVTVFKPGDVVRKKSNGSTWALGKVAYLALDAGLGRSFDYGDNGGGISQFNSDLYELVYRT